MLLMYYTGYCWTVYADLFQSLKGNGYLLREKYFCIISISWDCSYTQFRLCVTVSQSGWGWKALPGVT